MQRTLQWIRNVHGTALTRRFTRAIVWICVLALAAVHLPLPLTGDQALYMYGAKSLAEGQALYLDFWDVKQPGVYLFYLLAGTLFSFDEVGLHILEALWFGLAAWFAYRIGRQSGSKNVLMLLIPLFTAGTYFVAVSPWHMAQPDGLLTTPLAGVAWALCDRQALTSRHSRLIVAGVFSGLAAIFKVSVIIVPLAMIAAWYLTTWSDAAVRDRFGRLRDYAWILAGVLLPLSAVTLWFALHGALGQLIWTTFHYPFIALSEIERHSSDFYFAARWFLDGTIFWLPFAAIGSAWSIRKVLHRNVSGQPGVLMLVWLVVGALTILLQYHYFWAFHFNQFFVPMGVLAVIGLRVLFGWANARMAAFAGPLLTGTIVFVLLALVAFGNRATLKFSPLLDAFASGDGLRSSFAQQYDPKTHQILESVSAALSDTNPSDSIYVFGDPRLLLASGRIQAVPYNGWALEMMTAEQWREFSNLLRSVAPMHLYISDKYLRLLPGKSPELMEWISLRYDLYHTDTMAGGWYKLR